VKTAITRRALELGFDACRFTTAAAPEAALRFKEWVASQRHGEMAYLERSAHKRVDPLQVLPGAKSIVSLAVSYESSTFNIQRSTLDSDEVRGPRPVAEPVLESSSLKQRPSAAISNSAIHDPRFPGVIARYARYTDYHEVLAEKLKALTAFLDQSGSEGTRSLWYVDTGPMLERDFAQRAGIGFVGKHTNLISRKLGNWIFLAEIITTLELEPDEPEMNRCGTCTQCIRACPTRAITGPFQLDARLCISYLTIELKGPIPAELRPAIGARIYGCDDCLAVCPWNRFAREGNLMKEHGRADLGQPDLIELLSLDDAGFEKKFANTPMLRAKRRGLLRNVCVALGNIGDATALPVLERAANDAEPMIAGHAGWAMERIAARAQE
jgi:epoxyqueuosine reductase